MLNMLKRKFSSESIERKNNENGVEYADNSFGRNINELCRHYMVDGSNGAKTIIGNIANQTIANRFDSFTEIPLSHGIDKTQQELSDEIDKLKEVNVDLRLKLKQREMTIRLANDELKRAHEVISESEKLFRSMLYVHTIPDDIHSVVQTDKSCQTAQDLDSVEHLKVLFMKFLRSDHKERPYISKALSMALKLNDKQVEILNGVLIKTLDH